MFYVILLSYLDKNIMGLIVVIDFGIWIIYYIVGVIYWFV